MAGETKDLVLPVSETYTGIAVGVAVRVIRAPRPGPAVFLTGAVHGDELNGTGAIREVMLRRAGWLERGTLVCVPVVNVFGFESHSRYLPDRRDLNRCFPGSPDGSLADRLASVVFREVVSRCDYGIELHTAPARRTNFPNVRGDLKNPEVARLARAFGCEVVLHSKGVEGSLRRVATRRGRPTVLLEAGESLKFQPAMIEVAVRGIDNVLRALGMRGGKVVRPAWQTLAARSRWVRSPRGGILRFHVAPGDLVERGEPIASCDDLFGRESVEIPAPVDGVLIGMTTLPAVKPGEPVGHVAVPDRPLAAIRREVRAAPRALHRRARAQLAAGVAVSRRRRRS